MIRNVLGSVVALVGAAAAVVSPFLDWYEGRRGRDYRVQDLFGGITDTSSGVLVSILLPFLLAALVALVGVLLRSRLMVALAGLVVLGFTVLWMVRQGQEAGSLSVGGDGSGLQVGVALAGAGGLLLLLGAALMSGRARRRTGRHAEPYAAPGSDHPDTWPPTQEPGPSVQTSPGPEREADPYVGPDPRDTEETRTYPTQEGHRRRPPNA
ncbi:hypothetical protein F0344_14530 [Streptomyces finlayi]|uniref:Uncharacterized protein n=1 Tax=Streptomyces finlayi TaxID=67296 RepID=A0A7G7BK17_9ACTN|nr:hypothetical protein [Streptomyces finlayi]QNE75682.1 hypothetical protein F0344_14530 [Streptomyces finlayi]